LYSSSNIVCYVDEMGRLCSIHGPEMYIEFFSPKVSREENTWESRHRGEDYINARFQIFRAMIEFVVFWIVAPCSMVHGYQH
jgi:hypothetical protein